jgi:mono/diheme cytochrome c family protein
MRLVFVHAIILLLALGGRAALAGKSAPPLLNPKEVEAGRVVYGQYCASCHGARGEGEPNWEELNAKGELPSPPHDAEGHTWKHADGILYRMVSEGWRDPFNKTERLTMPAFREVLSPEQIQDVVTYLKTLWTPEQRQFQWEETLVRGAFPPQTRAGSHRPPAQAQ